MYGARRAFRRFIGVHLGGGRGKNTAVARLEVSTEQSDGDDGEPRTVEIAEARVRHGHRGAGESSHDGNGDRLFRDEVLVSYLERWVDEHTVVSINAPLTLPPCIRCTLPCPGTSSCTVPVVAWMRRHAIKIAYNGRRGRSDRGKPAVTPYTQRAVDLLLTSAGLKPRESLGQGMGPLSARAAYLRRVLSPRLRMHENLIEVHPPATVIRLFGSAVEHRLRNGDRETVWELRKQILTRLPESRTPSACGDEHALRFAYVWPETVVRSPHVFDAVVCAYTAFLWAQEGWRGPRDLLGGTAAGDAGAPESPGLGDQAARARAAATAEAVGELEQDHLWLDDGWIWAPPARSGGSRRTDEGPVR